MRVLITGITGFAGGHLAEALLAAGGVELFGVSRRGQWPEEWRHLAGRVVLRGCDLGDPDRVDHMLRQAKPERIYHVAGYAHPGHSFRDADAAWAGNLAATRCLYEAIIRWGARPRILYVSSGLIYGDPTPVAGRPGLEACDEDCPLRPSSPYAASKAAADLASYQYTRSPGLDIVRARPFNHIGPRQSPQYAVAHFAQQIAAIERQQQPAVLETGNLSPLRDLTDVRDTVQAYILVMEHGRGGEAYNVASGAAHSIRAILDRLLALTTARIEVRQQPQLVRVEETHATRGHAAKLCRETGWRPRYSLEQTLADTLAYWRQKS